MRRVAAFTVVLARAFGVGAAIGNAAGPIDNGGGVTGVTTMTTAGGHGMTP
jgi:hypothetical protein